MAKKYVLYPPACRQNYKLYQHICYNEVANLIFYLQNFRKNGTNYHDYRLIGRGGHTDPRKKILLFFGKKAHFLLHKSPLKRAQLRPVPDET